MAEFLKRFSNIHLPSKQEKDVLIFTTARSGSTLVNEMIATQHSFKPIKRSLFDFRDDKARIELSRYGLTDWEDYYDDEKLPQVKAYIESFRSGKTRGSDPLFFRNHWRLITRRLVFKALNAYEDRIDWFREELGLAIVYLIRHPIPVSLSRAVLPRLNYMLNSRYREHFTTDQLALADDLCAKGSKMQQAVLDWSLQNAICLRDMSSDWTVVSYEQLVLEPEKIIKILCDRLNLSEPEKMEAQLFRPSQSTSLSDAKTKQILEKGGGGSLSAQDDEARKQYLVERWRKKIGSAEEKNLMDIVEQFGIDAYRFGCTRPDDKYWV